MVFVYPNGRPTESVDLSEEEIAKGAEIEERIVEKLAEQHGHFIGSTPSK